MFSLNKCLVHTCNNLALSTFDENGNLDPTFDIYGADTQTCGTGRVDVNGVKGPNVAVTNSAKPEDQFTFTIFETKVVPGTAANSVEAAVMYDNKTATAQSGT